MKRLPDGRLGTAGARRTGGYCRLRYWGRLTTLTAALAVCGLALPAGGASAARAPRVPASLKALVARANRLSNEIDILGQQYDGLRIQLAAARGEVALARESYRRDERLLGLGQRAVAQIAALGYMTGGVDPAVQLLQSNNPQSLLDQASIMTQLQQEDGSKLNAVAAAQAAAQRAQQAAAQQERQAVKLAQAMRRKVAVIQAKEKVLNSKAFAQALAYYDRTGSYPVIAVSGNSLGARVVRYAESRIGDPYVWGGAGPSDFDCSGLVMWAYAQVGISLEHYTGDQWNEGEHIPLSELRPGDLVFFFASISHVGIYIGHGLMVDAPTFGQDVQIQPVYWAYVVGAVRIVA